MIGAGVLGLVALFFIARQCQQTLEPKAEPRRRSRQRLGRSAGAYCGRRGQEQVEGRRPAPSRNPRHLQPQKHRVPGGEHHGRYPEVALVELHPFGVDLRHRLFAMGAEVAVPSLQRTDIVLAVVSKLRNLEQVRGRLEDLPGPGQVGFREILEESSRPTKAVIFWDIYSK